MRNYIETQSSFGDEQTQLGLAGRVVRFEGVLPEGGWRRQAEFLEMEEALVAQMESSWGSEWKSRVCEWSATELLRSMGQVDYVMSIPRKGVDWGDGLADTLERVGGMPVHRVVSYKKSWDMAVDLAGQRKGDSVAGVYDGEFGLAVHVWGPREADAVFIPWEVYENGAVIDHRIRDFYLTEQNFSQELAAKKGVLVDNVCRRGRTGRRMLEQLYQVGVTFESMVVNVGLGEEGIEKIIEEMRMQTGNDGLSRNLLVPIPASLEYVNGLEYEAVVGQPRLWRSE